MNQEQKQVFEVRLKLDETGSFEEALEVAKRVQHKIATLASQTDSAIVWRERRDPVLGAPHLILEAAGDFAAKIQQFSEVQTVEPALYPTLPRTLKAEFAATAANGNQPARDTGRARQLLKRFFK